MTQGGSNGNPETRTQIEAAYAVYGGAIFRFAVRLCGNRDDAEDIVVETFVSAFQNWNDFKGTGSRRAWLFGIAHNAYRMTRRRQKRNPERISDEVEAQDRISHEWIALQQAVNELSLTQRESFLLVKGEGLTAKEASEALSRPIGTICSDVFHATRNLRQKLTGIAPTSQRPAKSCEVEP